jgi:uncharacterized protein involved in exopolysaccharide biosynthesis
MADNNTNNNQINQVEEDEIDLIALVKTIWNSRKTIIAFVIIGAIIGVLVALTSEIQYTASSTMVPQVSKGTSKLGGLSSLAAMAGFNLDLNKGGSGELSPFVYPQIVKSVPFQLELMNTPFTFSEIDHPISIYDYYTQYQDTGFFYQLKKYTIGLPGVIIKALRPTPTKITISYNDSLRNKPIYLSKEQEEVRKIIDNNISLETNDKDGYVTLTTFAIEAQLAAEVTSRAQELLQKYITEFKTEKAAAQLEFIKGRYEETKQKFEEAQTALANFRDRNKNVTSARARTQEERLQSEFQLAFDVYSGVAQQMEQARITVKEETPVFSIIKPVTVPLERSKPKRKIILIIWIFLGGVFGIGWIFGKQFLATIKTKWNEEPEEKTEN